MPAPIGSDQAERQIRDAFERGQTALTGGDKSLAMRWLDRAHRLAPQDATIKLVLASAAIGDDNPTAAALFAAVLASGDVRDAWFGLASARLLMGDLSAARDAVAEALSRHVIWPDIASLAGQLVRATGAAGWCGLTNTGALAVHPAGTTKLEIRIDGKPLEGPDGLMLPAAWPRARSVTVTESGDGGLRHLIGSPISLRAIGRVDGQAEAFQGGVRGWAWCPGDPEADPHLSVSIGRTRRVVVATEVVHGIDGLVPLARPRSFVISRDELPAGTAQIRVRGRDGRDLSGSPLASPLVLPAAVSRAVALPSPEARRVSAPTAIARPAPPTRRRLDLVQWRDNALPTVVLVTHNDGGGVERRIQASVAAHEAQGRRAIVLRPAHSPGGSAQVVAVSGSFPDLRFDLPGEQASLLRLLTGARPAAAELHHFLNHDASIFEIIRALGVPYEAHVHDYAWFCPRIALVGRGDRYCGEPASAACQTCVTELGNYLHDGISVANLLDRSMAVLSGASRVIAPSQDAAARLARHFPGIFPVVVPHEDDTATPEPPPIPCVGGTMRVCVAGAIGLHKGFDVLLACARDAKQRDLDLEFVVAGTTIDDHALMATGRVFVTGPYQPDEVVALIRAQRAAIGLLPSIWPETWCLGLTEL
jgi:glycosyltransferase involved in cell wall biosynthesis